MLKNDQNRIFLCHASEDKAQVLAVYDKLKAAGFNPWLDKKDLLPGQQWDREIRRVLKHSRFIMIFFSRYSVSKRGYVQREFKLALDTLEEIPDGEIFIIPVRLEDCLIPEAFRHIHYVDLFEPEGFDLVMKVIGAEIEVRPNEFKDPRDGQVYKTVGLLDKTWMAENLNFDVGEGSWFYDDDPENGKKYGRLYTWDAAIKACPPGWRLPGLKEIEAIIDRFGGAKGAYEALTEGGKSSFNAHLGGLRYTEGSFCDLRLTGGYYWSVTETGSDGAWIYNFDGGSRKLFCYYKSKGFGFSCRCVQI